MSLAYLALACQMRWTGEVSIIITLDWEKRIRVVKLCMTFESGPECKLTLFGAIYELGLNTVCLHGLHENVTFSET